jgi:5'-phosphate synthase pdxT subunit
MFIGVLALQGDFKEHLRSLAEHGAQGLEVRTVDDLKKVDALILPGGESTTMAKLLVSTGLDKAIKVRAKRGMPIWGACAGAILLAKNVISPVPLEATLGLLDITIERNSYGRQAESFEASVNIGAETHQVFFIRSPRITRVGKGIKVIARYKKDPILVQKGNILASTFHSELGAHNPVLNLASFRGL